MVAFDKELIKLEARKELARRNFWDYCNFFYPDFYKETKKFLLDFCNTLQGFMVSENKILVVNMPPRL
ncbi:hypothetical protein FNCP11_04850 [Fusobacterium nucleatum]|nr:hypothetical protein FNCP11_04850 [Fusobacterium nucleatum]BEP09561.1 hypothetical protein FNSP11_04050 [Fusobacterium nucleatum]